MLNKAVCKHCNKKSRSTWEPWDDAIFEHHWQQKVVLCPLGVFSLETTPPEKCMFALEHVLVEQQS